MSDRFITELNITVFTKSAFVAALVERQRDLQLRSQILYILSATYLNFSNGNCKEAS
jgi:hypothetical protein